MTDTIERDELGEQLIELGLVRNAFLLDLNSTVSTPAATELPAPWNLPSRLFRFPIEVSKPAKGFPRAIGLMHPLLGDHPFVQHVETLLGYELDRAGSPNPYGWTNTRTATWWHAVDLVSAGYWRELLETRQFTTDADLAGAVSYGLDYSPHDAEKGAGHITIAEARQIMAAIGAEEPADRGAILRSLSAPSPCRQDSGKGHWPINSGRSVTAEARMVADIRDRGRLIQARPRRFPRMDREGPGPLRRRG